MGNSFSCMTFSFYVLYVRVISNSVIFIKLKIEFKLLIFQIAQLILVIMLNYFFVIPYSRLFIHSRRVQNYKKKNYLVLDSQFTKLQPCASQCLLKFVLFVRIHTHTEAQRRGGGAKISHLSPFFSVRQIFNAISKNYIHTYISINDFSASSHT